MSNLSFESRSDEQLAHGETDSSEKELENWLKELKSAPQRVYYDETADAEQREEYYKDFLSEQEKFNPAQRYQGLHELLSRTHRNKLSYSPAQHLYPWVDLHPDLKLQSIYSKRELDPEALIQADRRADQIRQVRSQELRLRKTLLSPERLERELELLEASLPYNCEHVVPQSWFNKKNPMRGDLHHLFACETACNSFRGNIPYYDFPDYKNNIRDACGKRSENKFEPTGGKGATARATLYFLLRYPDEIDDNSREYQSERLEILLNWHQIHPVTEYERHRNAAIFEKQGNRNPLIDYPEWAEQIDFRQGLG
jgi:endonuclease I